MCNIFNKSNSNIFNIRIKRYVEKQKNFLVTKMPSFQGSTIYRNILSNKYINSKYIEKRLAYFVMNSETKRTCN